MNLEAIINMSLLGTTFMTLFVIMDPPGTIPVFLALTGRYSKEEQRKAARQATLTSLGVIFSFAVLGNYILKGLHISMESLQLSGGFLLFLVAMELLMDKDKPKQDSDDKRVNVALVPLGTPLLAGPGAIVAAMVSVNEGGGSLAGWVAVLVAILLMHAVMWITMRFAVELSRVLGQGGVMILTKISGLLLAAIATQLMATAIYAYVKGFPAGI